jgi:hypothetical protein
VAAPSGGLGAAAVRDVVDLHAVFVAWFAGRRADDGRARMEASLGPDFFQIPPDGRPLDRETVVTWLAGMFGRRPDTGIVIRDPVVLSETDETAVVLYVERHEPAGGPPTERWSTALFERWPAAPNGVRWRSVQETWRPA